VVVFASGSGSNFEALARAASDPKGACLDLDCGGRLPHGVVRLNGRGVGRPSVTRSWSVVGLVTNRPRAGAVARARLLDLPARVVPTLGRSPVAVASHTLEVLEELGTDVICLAGYLRLVPGPVVDRFRGRMINIHPGPLPEFGGKGMYGIGVHEAVIRAGLGESVVTVHHVVEEYDRGAELLSRPVRVLPGDPARSLARRVLMVEHFLYPLAVDRLCASLGCPGYRFPNQLAG